MKTATIRVNHIYGTRGDYCADIFYRGKRLATFDKRNILSWDSQAQGLLNYSRAWAQAHGFTHYKTIFG